MFVPLLPWHFFGSNDDSHITMNLRDSLCVDLVHDRGALQEGEGHGTVPLLLTFVRSMTSWSKECGFHSFFLPL
jgi:hypothetical protein